VRQARHFVEQNLPMVSDEVAMAVVLMVSELATNCIRHASTGFTIVVDIDTDTDELRVAVTDDGPGSPVVRSPTPSEATGRGLRIVAECSDDWGFAASPEEGTSVWFTMHLTRDPESAAQGFGLAPGAVSTSDQGAIPTSKGPPGASQQRADDERQSRETPHVPRNLHRARYCARTHQPAGRRVTSLGRRYH
jgi:anti-sigma regulatory factor (Ser/Thr protein kinase)